MQAPLLSTLITMQKGESMRIKVGMVVAKRERPALSELEKYLPNDWADVFLFPETYFLSEQLSDVCALVKRHRKWLITSMEDHREPGKIYQTGVVIDPGGCLIGEHRKTVLTDWEKEHSIQPGDSIQMIETGLGPIGLAVCYEIWFPEVARLYALQGAKILFNPIGTGMYYERQVEQWTTLARARAIENGMFVFGCSHDVDTIPIAFAYSPTGECLVFSREVNRLIRVVIDLEQTYETMSFTDRTPHLYQQICA